MPSAGLPVSALIGLKRLFFKLQQKMHVTHGLFNVAGEDMNLEVLRAPVTLGEGETITFH